jgi:hypothetical protein
VHWVVTLFAQSQLAGKPVSDVVSEHSAATSVGYSCPELSAKNENIIQGIIESNSLTTGSHFWKKRTRRTLFSLLSTQQAKPTC